MHCSSFFVVVANIDQNKTSANNFPGLIPERKSDGGTGNQILSYGKPFNKTFSFAAFYNRYVSCLHVAGIIQLDPFLDSGSNEPLPPASAPNISSSTLFANT